MSLLASLGLMASACGENQPDVVVESVVVDGAPIDAAAALTQALDATAEITNYGMSSAFGIDMRLPSAGVDQRVPLDPDAALMTVVVDGDRQYMRMDMSEMMASLGEPMDVGLEMWIDADQMIIDTRGFDLGDAVASDDPFSPGVSSVDLQALDARGGDIAEALGGSSATLAELTASLTGIQGLTVSDDGRSFAGTVDFVSAMAAANGDDVEQMMESMTAGFGQNPNIDADELMAFVVEAFAEIEVAVTVQLDESFRLQQFWMDIDMTPMFTAIADFASAADGLSGADRAAIEGELAGAQISMELLSMIDLDPAEIPDPPEATEDRTQQWLDLLGLLGMLDA